MTDETKPALTPEEWAARRWVRPEGQPLVVAATGGANVEILEIGGPDGADWQLFNAERHPMAALALHGQPFGFTHDDVAVLRGLASWTPHEWPGSDSLLRDLADRIAALLPPRDP